MTKVYVVGKHQCCNEDFHLYGVFSSPELAEKYQIEKWGHVYIEPNEYELDKGED